MNQQASIPVTQPSLPPLEEFIESLRDIWDRKWLTNNGVYHQRFEAALAEYLGVPQVSLFCNGMIALQVGLQVLGIQGEVITTPYSFSATTHAIKWNHCMPVFADIDPATGNLDPARIEERITPRTTCILPVHVYGNPCDVEGIEAVAKKHGLKVFYDAAHAFGVRRRGTSILNHGDLSMLSFHATKVFNSIEGGALVCADPKMKQRIDQLKNFGFVNETTVVAAGTNGKMNEIQAAYGLIQLKYIDAEIKKRAEIVSLYHRELAKIPGIRLLAIPEDTRLNHAYFPVFVDAGKFGCSRDQLYEHLKQHGIFGRRYFYPLISSFAEYREIPSARPELLPVAETLAAQVICLPLYAGLEAAKILEICRCIGELQDSFRSGKSDRI